MNIEEKTYPMRINRYLALENVCSRREADEIIKQGKVIINGRVAVLGDKVLENDNVEVFLDGAEKELVYFAYNKPRGIITHSPQHGEKSIENITKFPQKVYPVGRLDKDSHGLIILTNDGRVTGKLLSPENFHEKEYTVKIDRAITPSFLKHMEEGVVLDDGYKTQPAKTKKINDFTFSIILIEGKKRQIRRMCESLGRNVTDLKRIRILNIQLDDIKSGKFRSIEGKELQDFLNKIGL
ncbi:MAG: pseudouridine synthase [Parcubacteria group bacterium]|jgi:23S rRNA pseudouridine2604 synthase